MALKTGVLRWRSRRPSDQEHAETFSLHFASSIGEMDELKRRTPPTVFEADNGKRLKRFRRMLLDDSEKNAALNVNGVRVPVHHEVLVASSPSLARLGHNIAITDSSVEAVRHFVGYLYGVDVFKDGDLSVEEALDLAKLFLKFDIDAAAIEAARYCLQRSKPGHLNKLCCVLQKVSEVRPQLAEKIAVNLFCVDLSLLDLSTMALVLTSLRLTEIQKLVAVGKWVKANSKDVDIKKLFGIVNLEYAGEAVKEMNERLMNKNWRINALEEELSAEEEQKKAVLAKLEEREEKIKTLTIAFDQQEKEIIALQSSPQPELRKPKLALKARDSRDSRKRRQFFQDKPSICPTVQAHKNKASMTDANTVKSPSILPSKRIVEAEVGNNMSGAIRDIPSAEGTECPETNAAASGPVRANENGATQSSIKVNDEDVTKNSSHKNALGKEIFYARTGPHCYKVMASISSDENDSDLAQPELEGKSTATFHDTGNIQVPKPQENNSDDANRTDETAEKEEEGANEVEELERKGTRRTCLSEAVESGPAPFVVPASFSEYVSELQLGWEHPSSGQSETTVLHQVRAIIKLRSMTQASFAKEAGISQGTASMYLRGKYGGSLRNVEEKLAIFVQKYLEDNPQFNSFTPSKTVAAPPINTEIRVMESPVRAREKAEVQENQSDGPEDTEQRASMPPQTSPIHAQVMFPPLEKFRKVCILPPKFEM